MVLDCTVLCFMAVFGKLGFLAMAVAMVQSWMGLSTILPIWSAFASISILVLFLMIWQVLVRVFLGFNSKFCWKIAVFYCCFFLFAYVFVAAVIGSAIASFLESALYCCSWFNLIAGAVSDELSIHFIGFVTTKPLYSRGCIVSIGFGWFLSVEVHRFAFLLCGGCFQPSENGESCNEAEE